MPVAGAARAVRLVEPDARAQISMAIHATAGSVAARAFLNVAAAAPLNEVFELERQDYLTGRNRC
jgi:hypothetical protein